MLSPSVLKIVEPFIMEGRLMMKKQHTTTSIQRSKSAKGAGLDTFITMIMVSGVRLPLAGTS